jgi:hypothetical protein
MNEGMGSQYVAQRVRLQGVTSLADPSTELNALDGSAKGVLLVVYQTVAGNDEMTIYSYDDASSTAENVPFTVDGASGTWIAIAGRYVNGDQSIGGTITENLFVSDPLIYLNSDLGAVAPTVDSGFFVNRGSSDNVGFMWDESADEFAAVVGAAEVGTTAGNVTIDSYAAMHVGALATGDITISSAIPTINFYDTDTTDGDRSGYIVLEATAIGTGVEDVDFSIYQQIGGAELRTYFSDADQGIYLYPLGESANPVSITTGGAVDIPGGLTLSKGSQNYLFTDIGSTMFLQGQSSSTGTRLGIASKDNDYTDVVGLEIYGGMAGAFPTTTDREYMKVSWDGSANYEISTQADGAGTLRPLVLYTEGNANQLYLATGGQNIMGHNASIAAGVETKLQIHGTTIGNASQSLFEYSTTLDDSSALIFAKSNNASLATNTLLVDNHLLGAMYFMGADGSDYNTNGAAIKVRVDGTPAANKMPSEIELWTALGSVANDNAISAKIHKDAMLDLYGGIISILAGAENGSKLRGNSATKQMRFAIPNYNTGLDPFNFVRAVSSSTENAILIGGSDTGTLSPTVITMNTASDLTTASATEVARFEGGASKALMMGLGNSALSNWKPGTGGNGFKALQVGLHGALSYWDAGKGFSLSENRYFSDVGGDSWKAMRTTASGSSFYSQSSGAHYFYVATTATADVTLSDDLALTIANDASSTFGGAILAASNDVGAIGASGTAFSDLFLADAGVINWNAGGASITHTTSTNQLAISGGTGGVRLDNTVGIGVAPSVNSLIGASPTGLISTNHFYLANFAPALTLGASDNFNGIFINPAITLDNGTTHGTVAGIRIEGFATTETTASLVTNLAGLYVAAAPTYSGSASDVTNGPYSIFVDAGRSRFDGFINHGPAASAILSTGDFTAVGSHYKIVVEGGTGAGADSVATITGGKEGDEIFLSPATSGASDQISIVNGSGVNRIITAGGAAFIMDDVNDRWHGIHNGTGWVEVSRSSNS